MEDRVRVTDGARDFITGLGEDATAALNAVIEAFFASAPLEGSPSLVVYVDTHHKYCRAFSVVDWGTPTTQVDACKELLAALAEQVPWLRSQSCGFRKIASLGVEPRDPHEGEGGRSESVQGKLVSFF